MDANVGIVLYHEKLIKTQDINRYKTVHFFLKWYPIGFVCQYLKLRKPEG